ncbi:hypothetical protein C1645_882162, partial [Glomus cerebriforme]
MSLNNIILKDDETFLREFLKDFYRQIIKTEYHTKFENSLTGWVQNYLNYNEKNSEIILKLMENHEENEIWFSSIIGFFYEYDIILNKKDSDTKEVGNLENVYVMSHSNQFENFNGLEINICKDEINTMEKYFESLDKGSNENQPDYVKMKELMELNNLGYCYQYGIGKIKDKFKAFKSYLKSAEEGNPFAQNNLGYCYQKGIGITKDEKKAFELFLKAANGGDVYAQYNLGISYQNGTGINKDNKKAFEWYFKSAKGEYSS